MKKIIALIAICLTAAVGASNGIAQQPAASPAQPAAATTQNPECAPEKKLAWYNEFRQNFKTDTAKANDLAKKWLACPEVAGEEQITPYLKNFVTLYEKASRKDRVHELVYVKKDYPKALELARAVLVDEPDNLKVLIDFSWAGSASKNEAYSNETLAAANKAIQLIESGKTLENWNPYVSKDEALGYLYNAIGLLTVQKNPSDALPSLIKAAQFEGKLKKLPFTYGTIAQAYEAGPYTRLSEEYKKLYGGKDETPESKLALENINQIIDRVIDAYARGVALAGTEAANQAAKTAWMETLGGWYKFRNNQTVTGLPEMIAGILAKPLPPFPSPITTLPAATPASTPAAGSVNAAGTNPAANMASGPAPAGNTGAASTPAKTTTPAASSTKPNGTKPAAAPSPKPRSKRNHRGH